MAQRARNKRKNPDGGSVAIDRYENGNKEATSEVLKDEEYPNVAPQKGENRVSCRVGRTLRTIRQFEMLRIDVGVEMNCVPGTEKATFQDAADMVADLLGDELAEYENELE